MSLLNSLSDMSSYDSFEESYQNIRDYQPTYSEPVIPPEGWEEEFKDVRTYPSLYSLDGYISPVPYLNWGTNSPVMSQMSEEFYNIIGPQRIDPNKIFTSEIQSLRKISADQLRIIKMFEKKFMECMTEKGKFGITEEDVLAFNALMAARGQLTNTTKEQVNIKKNIAELKIKQNQAAKATQSSDNGTTNQQSQSVDNIGKSIMDNIFNLNFDNINSAPPQNIQQDYSTISSVDASMILDELIPSNDISSHIQYESLQPKTYVVIGQDSKDIEFQTFSANGELIPDYPNPTTKITNIDKDTGKATDELLVQYPIKYKDEL